MLARCPSPIRVAALLATLLVVAGAANAQLPLQQVGSQFDIIGFIQKATVDSPTDVLSGGTLQVNGHDIVVPRNTVLQMPAFALTWQQLFAMAPAPYTGVQTGMALTDTPAPLATYEIHVQGNRVGDTYIAGLIFISQQSLNSGQGFINYIDYANAELHVGGIIGDPNTGTRVRMNDPSGRWAPAYHGDDRFTIDTDNPTVRTETGYPMCFPHYNPAATADFQCPQWNRQKDPATGQYLTIYTFPPTGGPQQTPDPMYAAPFEIGDWVTYAGTLMKDGAQPTVGPMPANGTAGTYIAAHTILANLGFFTTPGTNPAYVATDVMLIGVGGNPIQGIPQEATARTRFEGFSTDITRVVRLAGIDVDGCSATTSDRDWGMINVDQGPPLGAVMGRWRFRPPSKVLLMPATGTFLPPTRMMRAWIDGAYPDPTTGKAVISGNGLITGQYAAPIFEFLFPENLGIGNPVPPFNFNEFPFLVNGTFNVAAGVNAGQLTPWPGVAGTASAAQAPVCGFPPGARPPQANAGADQTVISGSTVTLDGTKSVDPNGLFISYNWQQISGPTVDLLTSFGPLGGFSDLAQPTFTAPAVVAPATTVTLIFQLSVFNSDGLASNVDSVTITVKAPTATPVAPTANAGTAQTVGSGATVTLNGSASSDGNVPAQTLSYAWTETNTGGLPAVTLSSTTSATPTFTAPINNGTAAAILTFQLTVTNTSALSSTASVAITVTPNATPLANAGAPQTVGSNAVVQLNGTGSTDPHTPPQPLTYSWTQTGTGGLTAVTLSSATSATPTFKAPVNTTAANVVLTFQLTVTDTSGLTGTSTTTVTVKPVAPPVANAGTTQAVAPGTTVTLDGTLSSDPNGLPLTYSWTSPAGITLSSVSAAKPTFTTNTAGNYTFTLVVSNGYLTSAPSTVTIGVSSQADVVTITSALYKTNQRILTITATSSVPNGVPVLTALGAGVNGADVVIPWSAATATYTVKLAGVPQPFQVTVRSSLGGFASAVVTVK